MHTCRPTTTGRTKILAICAITAAMLRRMYVGGEGRQGRRVRACVCVCVYVAAECTCRYEKGVPTTAAPPCVVNPLALYFRNWRTSAYFSFNFQPRVSRCNFTGSFFFCLFFPQLLSRLVSRGHLRVPARLLRPADDSTSSSAAFVFTDDFF